MECELDVPTLFVTTALSIALSGTFLLLARSKHGIDPLTWWGIAMMLGAAGLLLRIAPLPELLSLDVAKALLLLTGPASWTAARVFTGRRPAIGRALAGAVLWLLLCRIPAFRDSEAAQMAVSCALGGIYSFATAFALHPVRAEALPSGLTALILLYFHACVYTARAVLAVTGLDLAHDAQLAIVLMLEANVHTIAMAIVLVAMTKERVEHALAQSLATARAVGDSRARFVAHLSHEIRTPLNTMVGAAQLLRYGPDLRADQSQQVDMLEAAGRHILAIVNDALDLAKIDAGRLDIASVPLNPSEAAQDCAALVRPYAIEKRLVLGLDVASDVPSTVLGDGTRLRQILLNLAWNAVKFTPAGGSITLRVHVSDGLCFEVTDTGPGVAPDKQSLLFQEFSPLQLQESGTGLGLSLSASLAARMGGSLRYLPGPGSIGSVFRLTLPWVLSG